MLLAAKTLHQLSFHEPCVPALLGHDGFMQTWSSLVENDDDKVCTSAALPLPQQPPYTVCVASLPGVSLHGWPVCQHCTLGRVRSSVHCASQTASTHCLISSPPRLFCDQTTTTRVHPPLEHAAGAVKPGLVSVGHVWRPRDELPARQPKSQAQALHQPWHCTGLVGRPLSRRRRWHCCYCSRTSSQSRQQ